MPLAEEFFAPQGALAFLLDDYQLRTEQLELAKHIEKTIASNRILLAEAGTGIGKTFAYLFSVLSKNKKTLISTATKALQEQIFTQDIPLMCRATMSTARIVLLKGRENYLCHFRCTNWLNNFSGDLFQSELEDYHEKVRNFFEHTRDGDIALLENIPEDSNIFPAITSTAENCLGKECTFFEDCFVQQARQRAKEADVVVVNHHLLLADFALKQEGFAEILPEVELFIIDEAHHLPACMLTFLDEKLSARQLKLLLDDLIEIYEQKEDCYSPTLIKHMQQGKNLVDMAVSAYHSKETISISAIAHPFYISLTRLRENLDKIIEELDHYAQFKKVQERLVAQYATLVALITYLKTPDLLYRAKEQVFAQWLHQSGNNFSFHQVPLNTAQYFLSWLQRSEASWIFLSATLTIGDSFDYFRSSLGLPETVETLKIGSPFDYRKQAILYHPPLIQQPNDTQYTQAVIEAALPIVKYTRGRAFFLFTSHRAVKIAEQALRGSDFHLLVQGSASKTQLLAEFRQRSYAILLATTSFWEGIDVRGDKLVCVVIDKLPFKSPDDPLTRAQNQYLTEEGLSPFMHSTLPQAVIVLKQGVGRLIRDIQDYGVLILPDPRLTQKNYGKIFLDSLPDMYRTTQLHIVKNFLDHHESST